MANPPFLPNPDNIASQAVALYGNGGAFGEDVLRKIVAKAPEHLVPGSKGQGEGVCGAESGVEGNA